MGSTHSIMIVNESDVARYSCIRRCEAVRATAMRRLSRPPELSNQRLASPGHEISDCPPRTLCLRKYSFFGEKGEEDSEG